jgi:NAD(P)-dependent dehydrogenase (short-subunit alcohol dehydrogenase family)
MGTPPALTKDGYEEQFGINYLAHALLVKLLLPALRQSSLTAGDGRVILLTSLGYKIPVPGGIAFDTLKTRQEDLGMLPQWRRYGQSKLAMILFANALDKREPTITARAIHPGISFTGLVTTLPKFDYWFVKLTTLGQTISPEQASWNTLWAVSTDKSNLQTKNAGEIFIPVGVIDPPTKSARDEQLANKLWDWTDQALAPYYASG